MHLIPIWTLFLFSLTTLCVQSESSFQDLTNNDSLSCPDYQSPCGTGCCPYADGVCCTDGFECCQHGQTCIPYIGLCIGIVKNPKEDLGVSLNSSKATPVKSLITACPAGSTECSEGECCPYPGGVCCDATHCCPQGYTCDLPGNRCVMESINSTKFTASSDKFIPIINSIKKTPYKSCPGTSKICPIYSSCCILEGDEWGCCPNPSLKNIQIGVSLSSPMKNLLTACPSGTTECTEGKCCGYPNAVCCIDGDHCCPEGYECDLPKKRCDLPSNHVGSTKFSVSLDKTLPITDFVNYQVYKSCPGSNKSCAKNSSCCILDDGEWGCCPNPSLKNIQKENFRFYCCDTIYGFICCPEGAVCTYGGCI